MARLEPLKGPSLHAPDPLSTEAAGHSAVHPLREPDASAVDRNNQPLCGIPTARVVDHGEWHRTPDVERRFLIALARLP